MAICNHTAPNNLYEYPNYKSVGTYFDENILMLCANQERIL